MLPDTLIIYREGLSDAQIKKTVNDEIDCLHLIINKIKSNFSQFKEYNPEIVFFTVNKKVNSKFYDFKQNTEANQMFVNNPSSGSIIYCEMAARNEIDFYLVPQVVSSESGTASPSQYRLIYYKAKNLNSDST